jgi:hypothetical protein
VFFKTLATLSSTCRLDGRLLAYAKAGRLVALQQLKHFVVLKPATASLVYYGRDGGSDVHSELKARQGPKGRGVAWAKPLVPAALKQAALPGARKDGVATFRHR